VEISIDGSEEMQTILDSLLESRNKQNKKLKLKQKNGIRELYAT
jgi:hypothetical protein